MKTWEGFRRGINLGGWFSQCDHDEEHYDSFIEDADFPVIKGWGADHVRVPVDYELLEDAEGNPLEKGYVRLENTVLQCRRAGLNMIIDLHKTAGFSFDPDEQEAGFFENEAYQERFYSLWERIAERFGMHSDMLAFELLNEVTEKDYCGVWNRISHECIRRIRKHAPDVKILVGGYWHNSALSVKDIAAPYDGNIVFNFHCYEPLIFTHQGAHWMPTMDKSLRLPVTASFGELEEASRRNLPSDCSGLENYPPETKLSPEYFIDFMREAAEAAERNGVALYCGEYGVIDCVAPEYALCWFRMIHEAFEHYGIGRSAWSYRRMDFGLSDERMDGVREELLKYI